MYSAFLFLLITIMGYGKSAVLRKNTTSELKVPESLLMELIHVENASQFVSQFIASRRPQGYKVFLAYLEDGKKETTSLEAVGEANPDNSTIPVAKNADCKPEETLVELPASEDPSVIVWPRCTRVKRCGGCCYSDRLKCQPTMTSTLSIRTISAKYTTPGSSKFDFNRYDTIQLEQHDKCRCTCKEKAEDCNSLQVYSENDCRCKCKNAEDASECKGPNHHWDPTECSCKCNTLRECSTGFFFNPQDCRCMAVRAPLQGVSSSGFIGVRHVYKDDGGENDQYHSRHIGIRPLGENEPFRP